MDEISYIKSEMKGGVWRCSPMPDSVNLAQSPGLDINARANKHLSRWGEQLEQAYQNYSFSSYVKSVSTPHVVVMQLDVPKGEECSAGFLFRTRTKYRKLRLFQLVFNLRKYQWRDCIPFGQKNCISSSSIADNEWFRIGIHTQLFPYANKYQGG